MTKPLLRLVSLAVGVLGEAIFLVWLLHGNNATTGWMQAAALHCVSGTALAWGCSRILPGSLPRLSLFWFLLAVNLSIPGAALLILLALAGKRPLPKRSGNPVSVYNPPPLSEDGHLPLPGSASRRVRQSILDILQHAEGPARADAILALKDTEPAQAMPLLRRALQDSDDLVRIYAQNLLNRIVERVEGATRQLERQLKESRNSFCLVRLAEQYHELVYLGVVTEPEGRRSLLKKALALLEEAIVLEPGNAHLHLLALQYSLRDRNLGGARRHLAKAEALPGTAPEQLLPLKGELAFLEKNWTVLHSVLEEAQPRAGGQMAAICQFWESSANLPRS